MDTSDDDDSAMNSPPSPQPRVTRLVFLPPSLTPAGEMWPREEHFVIGRRALPLMPTVTQVHVLTRFIDCSPYMWGYMLRRYDPLHWLPLTMGECVGEVLVNVPATDMLPALTAGTLVIGRWGWAAEVVVERSSIQPLARYHHGRPAASLGVLGMPGRTAYFGLLRLCRPTKGDTLFVSSGASTVGAIVAQIAKHHCGCIRVVGCAGTAEKLNYMRSIGFDDCFNYKEEDAGAALDRCAPSGIDVIFDNTGGRVAEAAALRLRPGARVAICGNIANTADGRGPKAMRRRLRNAQRRALWRHRWAPWRAMDEMRLLRLVHCEWPHALSVSRNLQPAPHTFDTGRGHASITWEAFMCGRFDSAEGKAVAETQLAEWMDSGMLTSRAEVRRGGLSDVPRAFVDLIGGRTRGKVVVELVGRWASGRGAAADVAAEDRPVPAIALPPPEALVMHGLLANK